MSKIFFFLIQLAQYWIIYGEEDMLCYGHKNTWFGLWKYIDLNISDVGKNKFIGWIHFIPLQNNTKLKIL